ncbi:hypothetical protein B0H14DRAFT_2593837 [Mycena olivaceomarginata]|nr:hypothetical protein B0H14DRAFT_2593837 [Mycena olivaceomarginata]
MPHVSLRQKLLRGAYKYAAKLQKWRQKERKQEEQLAEEEAEFVTGLGVTDALYEEEPGDNGADSSDASSVSSISSMGSLSSRLGIRSLLRSVLGLGLGLSSHEGESAQQRVSRGPVPKCITNLPLCLHEEK